MLRICDEKNEEEDDHYPSGTIAASDDDDQDFSGELNISCYNCKWVMTFLIKMVTSAIRFARTG